MEATHSSDCEGPKSATPRQSSRGNPPAEPRRGGNRKKKLTTATTAGRAITQTNFLPDKEEGGQAADQAQQKETEPELEQPVAGQVPKEPEEIPSPLPPSRRTKCGRLVKRPNKFQDT